MYVGEYVRECVSENVSRGPLSPHFSPGQGKRESNLDITVVLRMGKEREQFGEGESNLDITLILRMGSPFES